jgi:hypothetical protein
MVDVKKFWLYVHTTKVKKGWDWVELPDGRRISVPEGKYVKVMTIDGKTAIGFEDLTEEIGDNPDWDYQTPLCIIDEEVDGVHKVAKLRCIFTGRYHVSLFYEGVKVAEFWWGKIFDAPSFSYIDVQELAQQLSVAPAPAPAPVPVPTVPFDYTIDIYADKIIVNDAYGNTVATFSTINDLNNWIKNVSRKRIRINANVEVYDNLILPPNEYWIFGEWIHGNIYLLDGKHTIISFAKIGDAVFGGHVTNLDPETLRRTDVSGLKLYSVYADIDIHGTVDMVLNDVQIYAMNTLVSDIGYVVGDLYIIGHLILIEESTLINAYIDVNILYLLNVVSNNYRGLWTIISRLGAVINGTVDARYAGATVLYMRIGDIVTVNARSSASIALPRILGSGIQYNVALIGVMKGSDPFFVDPLPSGVTYQFDDVNNALVINNTTDNSYTIIVAYEIATTYFSVG